MAALKQHARLLYLLVLFQLVGGPLVLGGFMLAARLMMTQEVSLAQSLDMSIERLQIAGGWKASDSSDPWHLTTEQTPTHRKLPGKNKNKDKTPDTKSKLWALDDLGHSHWRMIPDVCALRRGVPERTPPRLANAPPLPPPRLG